MTTEILNQPKNPRQGKRKKHRMRFLRLISLKSAVQLAVVLVLSILLFSYMHAALNAELTLSLYIDGVSVGQVSSPSTVKKALERIVSENSTEYVSSVDVDTRFFFGLQGKDAELLDSDDCYVLLSGYIENNYIKAFALRYKGSLVAHLSTREAAEQVIERIEILLMHAISDTEGAGASIDLRSEYSIEEVTCEKSAVKDADAVYEMLYTGYESYLGSDSTQSPSAPESIPTPPQGEQGQDGRLNAFFDENTFLYEIYHSVDVLRNPTVNPILTDEVQSMLSKIELSYQTYHTEIGTELIPFQTQTIESNDYYVGTTIIRTEGQNGIREITYEVCSLAGKELSRKEVSSKEITSPVTAVVIVGVKPYPKPIPTGTYIWPLANDYYITSYFGWRDDPLTGEYRYHNGMDVSATKRTPIYAVDGGRVTFAGYDGTYGLCVIIDHGNGLESLYAHQHEILVSEGSYVYQGQQIGKVGDTGRTTGPHLHMEMRKDGERRDPLDYLPR